MRLSFKIFGFLAALSSLMPAEVIGPLEVVPVATAGSHGILLTDVVTNRTEQPVPRIQLAPAPAIGRPVLMSRMQIANLLKRAA